MFTRPIEASDYIHRTYIYIGMIDKKIYSHKYLFIYIYIQIQHINLDLYN